MEGQLKHDESSNEFPPTAKIRRLDTSYLVLEEDIFEEFKTARRSTSGSEEASPLERGLDWRSPFMMGGALLLGIIASVAHHFYYSSLVGKEVKYDEQQWPLRFGSAFSHGVQVCLVFSVWMAYTQWLWKTLNHKDTRISIGCLDDAFGAGTTILALLNHELFWKIKIGYILALTAWCLPLPSLFPPGTLFVLPSVRNFYSDVIVTSVDMYGPIQAKRFTYSTDMNVTNVLNSTEKNNEVFLGPRTILNRISLATATQGQILPILRAPEGASPNSANEVAFYGPIVQCRKADSDIEKIIQSLRIQSMDNSSTEAKELVNYFYAFVPDLSQFGNTAMDNKGVTAVPLTRLQQPGNASNELWMVYSQYVLDEIGNRVIRDHYSVCTLHNASYELDVSFEQGLQAVRTKTLKILNTVPYPRNDALFSDSLLVEHAYSAFMWALTDLIVGSMGIFQQPPLSPDRPPTNFSQITTQIAHTTLFGSSDFDVFFDKNDVLHYGNDGRYQAQIQRQKDVNMARNRTLERLIEELALNFTASFMNSDDLSPWRPRPVKFSVDINIYAYRSLTLALSYGLAISFTVIANLLGAYAYYKNGVSHTISFSSILAATRDAGFGELLSLNRRRKFPLTDRVLDTQVRLVDLEGGGAEFRIVGVR